MSKATVQTLKAENDKLKEKLQVISNELKKMQEEMTEHIESADDANLQTSRARKGQNNEFKQQIEIKISAIEDKLNAYPLASKTCLPRSSKLWNTVILIMSSLLVSPKSAAESSELCLKIFNAIAAYVQPRDIDIAHRVKPHNASGGQPKPIICKFTRHLARERV